MPACFSLADSVFPRVRAEAARRLVSQGLSQSRIAAVVGVSQAMVSKYAARTDQETDPLVLRLVDELVAEMAEGADGPARGASPWCATLTIGQQRPGASEALADLLAAEQRLLRSPPLAVMPQVGMNIARCLPDATGPEDVLAYPARLVEAGDRLVRPVPPAFGASGHLASCLLALRRNDPTLTAIANIRGGPAVRRAAGATVELSGDGLRDRLFAEAVADTAPRLVHDPGAVGYEPCLYVAGQTAAEVASQIIQIARRLTTSSETV